MDEKMEEMMETEMGKITAKINDESYMGEVMAK